MLDAIASRFIVLWGWRRLTVALIAGALSALALPPVDAFPVLFLTFPVLIWLIDGTVGSRSVRNALAAGLVGWAFGFGYFLAGLWWVGQAFLVEADSFGWMLPFAILALPAGLALFTAVGAFLARLLWSDGPQRIFAFALAITLSELARGTVLTGFPWNAYGYALTASPITMQAAAVFGINGLTAIAAFVFASPAALSGGGSRRARLAVPGLALCALAGIIGYGVVRLSAAETAMVDGLALRIVQPAIPQNQKWKPENRNDIFADYLALSDKAASPEAPGIAGVDLLIWPESALPFVFNAEPNALPAIAALLPPGTTLLTGMERVERDPGRADGYRIYNSVMIIDHRGNIVDIYDKAWLVPFGEFLPLQPVLEAVGLRQLTQKIGGFVAGDGPRSMRVDNAPSFVPLICYEIIFSGAILPGPLRGEDRPGWILNVTNDGWFGNSPGPWQHFRQARLRAVEEGLTLVRAANTGVSAVVDPYGRVVRRLDLGVRGVIDSGLPESLPPTPFSRFGSWIFAGLLCLLAAGAMINRTN